MRDKVLLTALVSCCIPLLGAAQSVHMPSYYNAGNTLDRIETLSGKFSDELHLTTQPLQQKRVGQYLFQQKSNIYEASLTNVDMYNINKLLYAQPEWLEELGGNSIYQKANNPIKPFYDNPVNLLEVYKRDFYLSINPKLGFNYTSDIGTQIAAGFEVKSTIAKRVSLFFEYTYHNDELPYWYHDYYASNQSLPDVGDETWKNGAINYHLPKGHIDVAVLKDHMNFTVGFGQHKIGDGYRSLMLNDHAQSSWYAKLTTQLWKFKYQNLYSVYRPQTVFKDYTGATDEYKFATTHHLSINLFRWLNVGVFESVMFGRSDRYEFGYINPIIFYRSVERGMGSPDKIIIGVNAKAIPVKSLNVYGQFILNEFSASEFFGSEKYWGNKWGAQMGLKYYNAFTIPNLDIQLEGNIVRPYTYSSNVKMGGQILSNHTHNNQFLAHPLGAGFREGIAIVRYQPKRKLYIDGRFVYYQQTNDNRVDGKTTGINPLKNYDNRADNYGVHTVNPYNYKSVMMGNLNVGYELLMNTYFELGATYRSYTPNVNAAKRDDFYFSAGVRMNLNRRDFNQL